MFPLFVFMFSKSFTIDADPVVDVLFHIHRFSKQPIISMNKTCKIKRHLVIISIKTIFAR